jgi:hypothetical protein
MIAVVEGPPGSGKSYSTVCRIAAALEAGKVVATNVELKPGWEYVVAKNNGIRRLVPGLVEKAAQSYRRRLYVSASIDELMRVRMPGTKEGRGVMVLDEAHNWCNARSWHEGDRERLVRFFSQHRKLGWDVFLISQRAENIDAQIRALAEYRVTLRNLRRFKVMGIPLLPFNWFLGIWTWEGGVRTIVKRDSHRLKRKLAGIYDTLAVSHGLEDDEFAPIWVPDPPPPPPADLPDLKQGQVSPRPADARTEPDRAVSDAVTPAVAAAPPPSLMPFPTADPSARSRGLRDLSGDPYPPPNVERPGLLPRTAPGSLGDAAPVSPATE